MLLAGSSPDVWILISFLNSKLWQLLGHVSEETPRARALGFRSSSRWLAVASQLRNMEASPLLGLGDDLLLNLFSWLSPAELARVSNASRRLRTVAYNQEQWRSFSERKWIHHNQAIFTSRHNPGHNHTDWRSLFAHDNGLQPSGPCFRQRVVLNGWATCTEHGDSSAGQLHGASIHALAAVPCELLLQSDTIASAAPQYRPGHALAVSLGSDLQLLGLPRARGAVADADTDAVATHQSSMATASQSSAAISYGHTTLGPGSTCCTALAWLPGSTCLLAGTMQGALHEVPAAMFTPGQGQANSPAAHRQAKQLIQPTGVPISDIVFLGEAAQQPPQLQLPCMAGASDMGSEADGTACHSDTSATTIPSQLMAAVLHDVLLDDPAHGAGIPHTRGSVQVFDIGASKLVCDMHDILDDWSLVALATIQPGSTHSCDGLPASAGSGPNVGAGFAAGGQCALGLSLALPVCRACWEAGNPWLCCHKQPVSSHCCVCSHNLAAA